MRYLDLFSGIAAASIAWDPLGWECVAFAEIDRFACDVLKHYHPRIQNLGDVTQITDAQIAALGQVDVVVGGSPCQDLSVGGLRAGLAGERSSLFHHQMRIFHAAKSLCGARYLLWENVLGAFSSNAGRDFAVVAGAMAGLDLAVPAGGWGYEGVAVGANGLVEWCVLDAQFFNLAQRRKRIFALLDCGDWPSRPPILLEAESSRGNSPTRRKTRSYVAPTDPGAAASGGIVGFDTYNQRLTGDVSQTLCGYEHLVPVIAFDPTQISHPENRSNPQPGDPCHTLAASSHPPVIAYSDDPAKPISANEQRTYTNEGCVFKMRNVVAYPTAVRRLTPRECERLQGFPDDYTRIPVRILKHRRITRARTEDRWEENPDGTWTLFSPDAPRYLALGNSFATTVIRWIGERIDAVTQPTTGATAP